MSKRNDILDSLETALETITVDNGYPISVAEVTRFWRQTNITEKHEIPLIMLLDGGGETLQVQSATKYRYEFDIKILGYVKTSTPKTTHDELNKLQAAIKQLIDSDPDLGDNCLTLQFTSTDGNSYDEDQSRAWVTVNASIIYYCDAGSF